MVNNALVNFSFNGDSRPKIHELQWSSMQSQLDGALKAALNTTQAALSDMQAQGFGRIINIGTNLVQNPVVPYHDYTSAKAALLAFTRTAAHELGHWAFMSICSLAAYYKPQMPVLPPPMQCLI